MTEASPPATVYRRLAAAVYDGLLLLALLMLATALLLPLTGGEAITPASAGPWENAYRAFLALVVVAYFGSAWTRRGETLGMKAWKIRVVRADGARCRWGDVLRRLAVAAPLYGLPLAALLALMAHRAGPWLVAASFVPLLASHAPLLRGAPALHDRWSRTRVVRAGG